MVGGDESEIVSSSSVEKEGEIISKRYDDLLGSYTDKIKELYSTFSRREKIACLGSLETLVYRMENRFDGRSDEFLLASDDMIPEGGNAFDYKQARLIREREGITCKLLAKNVGVSHGHLCRIENGVVNLNLNSVSGRRYLQWLKDRGYSCIKKTSI